jgi:rhodanese-related sulfurtransferase
MSEIRRIAPEEIGQAGSKAILIDVREPGEFAGKWFAGSVNIPLSRLDAGAARLEKSKPVIVLCGRGRKAQDAARRLQALGFSDIRVVEGGLRACDQGQIMRGEGGAWDMERQVRMAAGCLVLLGSALGWLVHPAFWLLSAGVGAGLVFSAATDTCGMAAVLAWLPWNRSCR